MSGRPTEDARHRRGRQAGARKRRLPARVLANELARVLAKEGDDWRTPTEPDWSFDEPAENRNTYFVERRFRNRCLIPAR